MAVTIVPKPAMVARWGKSGASPATVVRSVTKVVRYLNAEGLRLPRRDYWGDIVWRTPTIATVAVILKNPAYAGAFAYGRRIVDLHDGFPNPPTKARNDCTPTVEALHHLLPALRAAGYELVTVSELRR